MLDQLRSFLLPALPSAGSCNMWPLASNPNQRPIASSSVGSVVPVGMAAVSVGVHEKEEVEHG